MPRPHSVPRTRHHDNENDEDQWDFDDIVQGNINIESPLPAENLGIDEENNGKPWTLVSAFDLILENLEDLGQSPQQWIDCLFAANYLKSVLGMSNIQLIVVAMLLNSGKSMSWGMMARHLGISRLKMMTFTDEVEELVSKHRWLYHKGTNELAAATKALHSSGA